MEQTVLMVFAVVGVALLSFFLPFVGLIAVAWASFAWFGWPGSIVITLFYIRHGPSVLVWPSWASRAP